MVLKGHRAIEEKLAILLTKIISKSTSFLLIPEQSYLKYSLAELFQESTGPPEKEFLLS